MRYSFEVIVVYLLFLGVAFLFEALNQRLQCDVFVLQSAILLFEFPHLSLDRCRVHFSDHLDDSFRFLYAVFLRRLAADGCRVVGSETRTRFAHFDLRSQDEARAATRVCAPTQHRLTLCLDGEGIGGGSGLSGVSGGCPFVGTTSFSSSIPFSGAAGTIRLIFFFLTTVMIFFFFFLGCAAAVVVVVVDSSSNILEKSRERAPTGLYST